MTKSLLLPITVLAAAVAGCAQQRPAPVSAELNVMQVASDMGYNSPEVVDGKTLYCQQEELTGSMVPKVACIDADEVMAKARAQGDELKYLLQPPNTVARPGGG